MLNSKPVICGSIKVNDAVVNIYCYAETGDLIYSNGNGENIIKNVILTKPLEISTCVIPENYLGVIHAESQILLIKDGRTIEVQNLNKEVIGYIECQINGAYIRKEEI